MTEFWESSFKEKQTLRDRDYQINHLQELGSYWKSV